MEETTITNKALLLGDNDYFETGLINIGAGVEIMDYRETRLIEVERVTEAQALLELARYVVRAARSGDDGLALDHDDFLGLEYLLENVQAVIRV